MKMAQTNYSSFFHRSAWNESHLQAGVGEAFWAITNTRRGVSHDSDTLETVGQFNLKSGDQSLNANASSF